MGGAAIATVSLNCEPLILTLELDVTLGTGVEAPLALLLPAPALLVELGALILAVSGALALAAEAESAAGFEAVRPLLLPDAAAICRANSRSSRSSSRFLRLDAAFESAPPCCRCIWMAAISWKRLR
jgi:hypothetical protein